MNSAAEENYLKALFMLSNEKGEATVNEVSRFLDIKMPTVNSMMKRLAEKGYVIHTSYKPLVLTEMGRTAAALVIRKHRLTEMYLVEKMGFGWDEVHPIAEQIEHINAPEFFNKMDELLGYPKTDPHGSPIPDKSGWIAPTNYVKLNSCITGETVTLRALGQSSAALLKFLDAEELALGTIITINKVNRIDRSLQVSYGNKTAITLNLQIGDSLLVERNSSCD